MLAAGQVQQSYASIAPYTIEEAYEVADAIARDDLDALKEELGDLLLHDRRPLEPVVPGGELGHPDRDVVLLRKLFHLRFASASIEVVRDRPHVLPCRRVGEDDLQATERLRRIHVVGDDEVGAWCAITGIFFTRSMFSTPDCPD